MLSNNIDQHELLFSYSNLYFLLLGLLVVSCIALLVYWGVKASDRNHNDINRQFRSYLSGKSYSQDMKGR